MRRSPILEIAGDDMLGSSVLLVTMSGTGHLVFGTLHTNSAVQSINRIINVFSPHQQVQIRCLM
jgi:twitching motility protein PilT